MSSLNCDRQQLASFGVFLRFITGEGGWAGGQVRDVGLPRAAYAALCRVARSYSVERTEVVHQPTLQKGGKVILG